MYLACPNCLATNRIPPERLHDAPVCGRCKTPLMFDEPMPLADTALPVYLTNTELPNNLDWLSTDAFGKGWIAKFKVPAGTNLDHLMDAKGYAAYWDTRAH